MKTHSEKYPKNVRTLLFRGFLTQKITMRGLSVVLKTLNENERDLVDFYEPEDQSKRRLIRQVMYSIFKLEDLNILELRNDTGQITPVIDTLMKLNREFLQVLFEAASRLNSWYFFEIRNVHRYSLEQESRLIWPSYKTQAMNDPKFTGIPGTDLVGLNLHQMQWRVHNELEDNELLLKGIWQQAKFVASAIVGSKAIQKVHEQDKMAEEERETIKRRILKGDTGYTREDLVNETIDELERQMRGEKDEFDRFVEEEEIRQKMDKVKAALRESIFSQEIFRLRDRDTYVIGDEDFEEITERDMLQRAIDAVNRGSIRAELKMDSEQMFTLIGQVKKEVIEEIEVKYGELYASAES